MAKQKMAFRKTKRFLSFVDYVIQINTLLLIVGAGFVLYHFQHQFQEIRAIMFHSVFGTVFFFFIIFVLVFKVLFLLYLITQFYYYKPLESVGDDSLPYLTVIVPAYNEGRFVFETLKSIAQSNYPLKKIQLIAIDDGSSDDTWEWLQKSKQEFGSFLTIYQQPENLGKRYGLYRGFQNATGGVFVTIDSDSLVEKDTLRNLVTPFEVDSNVGAVAGNVKIYNHQKALIPKMLNVSFAFSFDFIRAAQSQMKTVLCTPGALSAYRREAVLGVLEDWVNQTFLGVKTDIGEDRAMTNMIMGQGYSILFQSNAVVHTNIPETYKTLRRMLTRWERSNVRENIMMSKFAFTNFRPTGTFKARLLLFNQWLVIISAFPSLIVMLFIMGLYPRLFLSSTIISVAIFSIVPAVYYGLEFSKRKAVWIFTYNIFYSFTLFWITPFAIVTAKRRGWLTRGGANPEVGGEIKL
jgi:hyaluronan synthase